MRAHWKLFVATLFFPALLIAQAPSTDAKPAATPAPASPADSKPAAPTQAPSSDANAPAAPAQAAKVEKPKAPVPYPVMSAAAKARARQIYEYFEHGQSAQLYATFSPGMKKNSAQARLATVSKQVSAKLGAPTQILGEIFLPSLTQPVTYYSRLTKFSKSPNSVVTALSINEQGQLDSLQIAPISDPPNDGYSKYEDKTKLRLPFEGSWMVSQGGRTVFLSNYVPSEDDRYADAFLFLKDGTPFANDGSTNEDYYCYGQPILAPAGGTVIQVVNNVPDNAPGHPQEGQSRGNYVVISHGNSEFSLLPYLKTGSVKVRSGQRVKQGDVVGACGDSGSSTAPHVEYRLQNTRGFPMPKTLPIQFTDYEADGKDVASGEPLRGQVVANKEQAPATETAAKPQ